MIVLGRVVGKWLDDHPRAVVVQCLTNMSCGSDRIAHVVQTIEERHEVVSFAWKLLSMRQPRTLHGH